MRRGGAGGRRDGGEREVRRGGRPGRGGREEGRRRGGPGLEEQAEFPPGEPASWRRGLQSRRLEGGSPSPWAVVGAGGEKSGAGEQEERGRDAEAGKGPASQGVRLQQ